MGWWTRYGVRRVQGTRLLPRGPIRQPCRGPIRASATLVAPLPPIHLVIHPSIHPSPSPYVYLFTINLSTYPLRSGLCHRVKRIGFLCARTFYLPRSLRTSRLLIGTHTHTDRLQSICMAVFNRVALEIANFLRQRRQQIHTCREQDRDDDSVVLGKLRDGCSKGS